MLGKTRYHAQIKFFALLHPKRVPACTALYWYYPNNPNLATRQLLRWSYTVVTSVCRCSSSARDLNHNPPLDTYSYAHSRCRRFVRRLFVLISRCVQDWGVTALPELFPERLKAVRRRSTNGGRSEARDVISSAKHMSYCGPTNSKTGAPSARAQLPNWLH